MKVLVDLMWLFRNILLEMPVKQTKTAEDGDLHAFLGEVKGLIAQTIQSTTLGFVLKEYESLEGSGKLLRSRLAFHAGTAVETDRKSLVYASAAVEMIHTASLLHDDVIDGGMLRRGAPTFWVERGTAGAILLGDLFLFKAIDLTHRVENGRMAHELVKLTGEVCEAESEQEIVLHGASSELETCVSIARRKTGALFAFAGYAAAGKDEALQDALKEAGYRLGTAYQMADDILDVFGDAEAVGKTLGTDHQRQIVSSADLHEVAIEKIAGLCAESADILDPWPKAQAGVQAYLDADLQPALDQLLACAAS